MENVPTVITIFGASGDLAKIKLFPSIYNLHINKILPENFRLIGFSRSKFSDDEFRKVFAENVKLRYTEDKVDQAELDKLLSKVHYYTGKYDNPEDYKKLRELVFADQPDKNKLININYPSIPPFVFRDVIHNLAVSREDQSEDIRLIIEKPFGEDAVSAQNLFHFVNTHFSPDQIYLLDHYLGKLAVQSLLHLRRANRILNSMIQGTEISNIQITAFEDVGVEERIGYFEQVGIIKDFVHSHMLQILALITMNIPTSKTGSSLSREKYSILSALNYSGRKEDLIIGQYETYAGHAGVAKDSKIETFAAMKLGIDLEEWYKVPIYLRVGKKLTRKVTYVVIDLEKYPFQEQYGVPMNRVVFKLQPDQKLIVKLYNQYLDGTMHEVNLESEILCDVKGKDVANNTEIMKKNALTEYATLVRDVMNRERLFFIDFQEVLASWRIMDQVIAHKNSGEIEILKYNDGTEGPDIVDQLAKQDGFTWEPY